MTCTFFGHRDAPNKIMPVLQAALVDLIENKHVDKFYVGNQGAFDCIVRSSLEELESEYPHIRYSVVLAYLPQKDTGYDYSHSVYPDGFESAPPKYAIVKRNRWMIDESDYVITYVKCAGGASKFKELAEKKGKVVINLPDLPEAE